MAGFFYRRMENLNEAAECGVFLLVSGNQS